MKLPGSWGMILLAAWLIATGALALFSGGSITNIAALLGVLAIAAGILLLIGR